MTWNAIDDGAATQVAEQLQPLLVDLIGLSLVGKQAHWTVTGAEFPQVHQQLDVVVQHARTAADRLAERMVALGAVPNGQPDRVATTNIPALTIGWQPTRDAITTVADGVQEVSTHIRKALPAVAAADPVTEGILIETLEQLEQQHWMLRAQLT